MERSAEFFTCDLCDLIAGQLESLFGAKEYLSLRRNVHTLRLLPRPDRLSGFVVVAGRKDYSWSVFAIAAPVLCKLPGKQRCTIVFASVSELSNSSEADQ